MLFFQPGNQGPSRLGIRRFFEPDDNTGYLTCQNVRGQPQWIRCFHRVAQIIEGHAGPPDDRMHPHGILIRQRLMNRQDRAWHRLDQADPHGIEFGSCHPGNHAQVDNFLRGRSGPLALGGRQVVDGNHRQAVLLADALQLAQQPFAIGLRHRAIVFRAGIIALVQGFRRHGEYLAMDCGQNLETAIEDQPRLGKSRLDGTDHRHQAGFLFGAGRIVAGHQMIGVERIQKEIAVSGVPERGDHLVGEKGWPAWSRLIDHTAAPGGVVTHQPVFRQLCRIGTTGLHFTDRNIGRQPRRFEQGHAWISHMIGIHDNHVKGLQDGPGWIRPIKESHRR